MDVGTLVIAFAGVMLCIGAVAAFIARRRDRETEAAAVLEASLAANNANSTATTSDHGSSAIVVMATPRTTLSPREQLEQTIAERLKLGVCLLCPDQAVLAAPAYEQVQPWFERMLRYFNAPLQTRYRVVVDRGTDAPYAYCRRCHERHVGLLMAENSDKATKQARFGDEQRLELTEYERFGVYERLFADAQAIKRGGGRKKRGVPTTNVRELRPANGTTASG